MHFLLAYGMKTIFNEKIYTRPTLHVKNHYFKGMCTVAPCIKLLRAMFTSQNTSIVTKEQRMQFIRMRWLVHIRRTEVAVLNREQ